MSQQNVDRVQAAFEHFLRTGEPHWESMHEDVELHDHDLIDAHEYHGWDGYARWFEDWGSAWAEFSLEPEEYLDAGDAVVAVFRLKAVGAGSGVTVERQDAMVCRMRDTRVGRIDYYNNREDALRDVGLEK